VARIAVLAVYRYDASGNMVDWWTEADGAEYEKRVEVMVKQASAFEVHGTPLQGKLTCETQTIYRTADIFL
jgi:predicted metalloendopeptidase